jgi:hypothetical protein
MRLATIALSLVAAAVAAAMPANEVMAESADYPGCVVSFAGVAPDTSDLGSWRVNSGTPSRRSQLPCYLHRQLRNRLLLAMHWYRG